MKIKSLLLVAPLVLSAGFLASCNNGQQAEAAEWSKVKESVSHYDTTASDYRLSGLDASIDVNYANLSGNLTLLGAFKGIPFNIDKKDISLSLGKQTALKETIPYDFVREIINTFSSGKSTMDLTNKIADRLYVGCVPMNDYTMFQLSGYTLDVTKPEATLYERMISKPWEKCKVTYKFADNKLSNVYGDIASLSAFQAEENERFGGYSGQALVESGDASINYAINIDTNNGYVTSVNLKGKSDSIVLSNLNDKTVISGDFRVAFKGKFDFDITINLKQTFSRKFTLQYKIKEYVPVYLGEIDDEKAYRFKLDKESDVFTKIDDLKAKYDIDFELINYNKILDNNYDDNRRQKDFYLTKDTPINTVYEGFDYDVMFNSKTLGFILNSQYNSYTMPESVDLVIKEGEKAVTCKYAEGWTDQLSYGSSVKCNTVELTDDCETTSTGYSPVRFGWLDATSDRNYLHISASKLDADNGTYTVSIGVFKKSL